MSSQSTDPLLVHQSSQSRPNSPNESDGIELSDTEAYCKMLEISGIVALIMAAISDESNDLECRRSSRLHLARHQAEAQLIFALSDIPEVSPLFANLGLR